MAANSIRLRTKLKDGIVSLQAIINHPMDNGMQKDGDGKLIPAHYIKEVVIYHNDNIVMRCDWSRAVSKDPYLFFMFTDAKAGDIIRLKWADNQAQTDSTQTVIS